MRPLMLPFIPIINILRIVPPTPKTNYHYVLLVIDCAAQSTEKFIGAGERNKSLVFNQRVHNFFQLLGLWVNAVWRLQPCQDAAHDRQRATDVSVARNGAAHVPISAQTYAAARRHAASHSWTGQWQWLAACQPISLTSSKRCLRQR